MSTFADTLSRLIEENNISCADDTVQKCEAYYYLLIEANKTTNLTRITGEKEASKMHFFGALETIKYIDIPQGAKVIDVGTGAGFPGVPLKIARPDLDFTLLDSAGKKTAFVENACKSIGIEADVLNIRVEETPELRENFDIAVSRALAGLNVLIELCVPLVKTGGSLIAFKGEKYKEELTGAKKAMELLHCSLETVHNLDTGNIIVLKKQKPTPDIYPRRFSKIKKNPL